MSRVWLASWRLRGVRFPHRRPPGGQTMFDSRLEAEKSIRSVIAFLLVEGSAGPISTLPNLKESVRRTKERLPGFGAYVREFVVHAYDRDSPVPVGVAQHRAAQGIAVGLLADLDRQLWSRYEQERIAQMIEEGTGYEYLEY